MRRPLHRRKPTLFQMRPIIMRANEMKGIVDNNKGSSDFPQMGHHIQMLSPPIRGNSAGDLSSSIQGP
jgi:hypothetical protein